MTIRSSKEVCELVQTHAQLSCDESCRLIEDGTFMARTRDNAFLGRPIEEAALACRRRRWLLDTMPEDDFMGFRPGPIRVLTRP